MPFSIEEWRGYLAIDKMALDDEVVRQPSLFYEVSEAYAEATAERDAEKEQLALIDAELDSDARQGKEKITEGQVKAYIAAAQDHINQHKHWLKAKKHADKVAALKDSFHQRSYMLRDLVTLHTSNYFEESSVRPTQNQDRDVYKTRRARLAAAREAKK